MQLSESDKQHIINWLNEKCGQMRCTCCGVGNWTLLDISTLPIGFDVRSTRFFYHQGLPQVTVACSNCGHLLNFSPGIMGLKPEPPEEMELPIQQETDTTGEDTNVAGD